MGLIEWLGELEHELRAAERRELADNVLMLQKDYRRRRADQFDRKFAALIEEREDPTL